MRLTLVKDPTARHREMRVHDLDLHPRKLEHERRPLVSPGLSLWTRHGIPLSLLRARVAFDVLKPETYRPIKSQKSNVKDPL